MDIDVDKIRTVTQKIWVDVLKAEVDDTTDFFDVGGHSFLATKIIALMDDALPMRTPVTTIFDHPRFDEFLAVVVAQSPVAQATPAP